MEGGRALAEALFGLLNPSGKVTISFPVHVGQQPVFYSQVRCQHGDRYADLPRNRSFPSDMTSITPGTRIPACG